MLSKNDFFNDAWFAWKEGSVMILWKNCALTLWCPQGPKMSKFTRFFIRSNYEAKVWKRRPRAFYRWQAQPCEMLRTLANCVWKFDFFFKLTYIFENCWGTKGLIFVPLFVWDERRQCHARCLKNCPFFNEEVSFPISKHLTNRI